MLNRTPSIARSSGWSFAPRFAVLAGVILGGGIAASAAEPARPALTSALASAPVPTFSRDVAPIIQDRCRGCHRRDQVGPFPLETFEQVRKRGDQVAEVVEERRMPPWKPEPGFGPALAHDRSLPAAEVSVLRRWVAAGMPRGDDRDLPPSRAYPEGWALGTPDVVLEMPEGFAVPAHGPDIYRCFVIPTNLPADVQVSAVEYRPGNARVVHHTMAMIEAGREARRKDAAEAGPGYTSYSGVGVDIVGDLGGWAAGNEAAHLPDGVGRILPKGADVILQIHYHPSGKAEVDRTRIGLYLSRKPVRQTLQWVGVSSTAIELPPGVPSKEVRARWTVPVDVDVLSVAPHMHQLGRSMQVTATHPSGRAANLLRVPDWDPSWQGTYSFAKPVRLVRGTIVEVVARYDNTDHGRNPNHPPKLVKFGHEVVDEMCVAYLGVVKAGQDLTQAGQRDDLFATLAEQVRRNQARDQFVATRRRR